MTIFRQEVLRAPDGVLGVDAASGTTPAADPAPQGDAASAGDKAAPQSMLDAPSLLASASAEKPAGDAAPAADTKPVEAKPADTKPADTKSSPVDAAPAKDAVVDAKAQDAAVADPAKAAEGEKPKPDAATAKEPDKDDKAKPDAKAADVKAEPPAAVAYEAFKAPEGLKLDDTKVKAFTDLAGPLQIPQDKAQAMLDLYGASLKDATSEIATQMRQDQRKVWNTLNDEWKSDFRKDPEIGGNREQTSLATAKAVIEEFLSPDQRQAYFAHIDLNGMSNFKEHIRLLAKIGDALNIFEDKIVPSLPTNPGNSRQKGFRRNYKTGNGAAV